VDVTPDLKFAKVYYSALRGDEKEVYLGLKSSAGFTRRQVAQRMNLRATPEFTFVEDNSIAYGAHISDLLHSITITPADEDEGEGEQ
jgi:ribosome-binding factor A